MEQQIIIPEHTVSEQIKRKKIVNISFNIDSKTFNIGIIDETAEFEVDKFYNVNILLSDVFSQLTDPQKTIIKGFFKGISAYALNISTDKIVGDFGD